MGRRLVKFLLCSLCVHFALFWALWHTGPAKWGTARNADSLVASASPLRVTIAAPKKTPVPQPTLPVEKSAHPTPAELPLTTPEVQPPETRDLVNATSQNYVPTGLLTRLPRPVTHIDLNTAAINEVAIAGEIKLTILINVNGAVDEVIASAEDENTREFADRVAERFKYARFMPGEINGKAVKSELRISVVGGSVDTSGADLLSTRDRDGGI